MIFLEGLWPNIVSMTGTLSRSGHHLHMSISDPECNVFGGHMLEGCIVRTTAEITLGIVSGVEFTRPMDPRRSVGISLSLFMHVEHADLCEVCNYWSISGKKRIASSVMLKRSACGVSPALLLMRGVILITSIGCFGKWQGQLP